MQLASFKFPDLSVLTYAPRSATCRPRRRCAEASEPRRASTAGAVIGHSGRRRCHIAAAASSSIATASNVMRQPRAPLHVSCAAWLAGWLAS
jgi:hypothetical protein